MSLLLGGNLPETLHKRVSQGAGKTALLRKVGGAWTSVSWREVEIAVFEIASALSAAGVQSGDRVAIISQNRPEWAFADWAILSLGAISVPVYPSITADDIYFILQDSGAKFAFIENSIQAGKLATLRPRLSALQSVVSFDELPSGGEIPSLKSWVREHRKDKGPEEGLALWRESAKSLDSSLPATIVYTSGTQGVPKGVVLSHSNFIEVMRDIASVIKVSEQDVTLLVLPMAHIMGRIEQMLSLGLGLVNAYSQGPGTLADELMDVRPTILFGVPRIFEKFRGAILAAFSPRRNRLRSLLHAWVLGAGRQFSRAIERGDKIGLFIKGQHEVLDRWIFSKVRSRFGGRLRFAVCGGAPLSQDVAEFFHACGILILEGYGLTETTGPACLNTPQAFRFGRVGRPLPRLQVKIAPDGEILLKGPGVCHGYYGDTAETQRSFKDGWLLTGDMGSIDADGFIRILDRKKDLIITSGGKNIAPQKIEDRFKSSLLISHVLVAGDGKPFLTALITVNVERARMFCERRNIPFRSVDDLIKNPLFRRHVDRIVARANQALPPFEQIKKHRLLARDFSIEAGELTPSLKVKRIFCTQKYGDLIEEMYV